jgi:hypothetical protein
VLGKRQHPFLRIATARRLLDHRSKEHGPREASGRIEESPAARRRLT